MPSPTPEQLYIIGTFIDHMKHSDVDKKPATGYKPNCVLLLPRACTNNNNDTCVNQNQTKTPRKKNSGGVRKAILNKRQDDTTGTATLKPKARRKTLVMSRKPALKTPLLMKQSIFPNNSLGCTLEYYLTHFNMFRDSDEARVMISDYLRGGPEVQRKEPTEQTLYRHIYGQLYGKHLEHVKKKIQNEQNSGGLTGMGKKTSLHIHQNCTCVSHDVTTD
ncbi:hypothetical protein M8J76_007580 [Diaphorina citri]|nr:hypothetical protein M8J76_007580 [Diaphorina citri]